VDAITYSWLVAAALSACMGLVQYFGWTHAWGSFIQGSNVGQAYANLGQRNHLATLLNIGLAALVWADAQKDGDRRGLLRVALIFGGAGLLAIANAATASRTGLMQLIVVGLLAWHWKNGRSIVWACAAAYLVAAILLPLGLGQAPFEGGILARLDGPMDSSASRTVLWSNVWHLITQKPGLGWGWGELDFAHFMTLYPGERFCDILDNAHNLPLHLAVTFGVPIALALCGLVVWWAAQNAPWREENPTRQLAWAVLALVGLHSMVEYPLWYGPFQLAVVLCGVLLWRVPRSGSAAGAEARPKADILGSKESLARISVAVAAMIFIAVSGFTGWDYWRISQLYIPPAARAEAYREDTLAKVKNTWLFQEQVQFAELTTTPLTAANAAHLNAMAHKLLHFSPEPRVIEPLIESAVMLGRDDEALFYLNRYKVAFPEAHLRWAPVETPPNRAIVATGQRP